MDSVGISLDESWKSGVSSPHSSYEVHKVP